MKVSCALVYVPGYPFTLDALRPNPKLARLAGCLDACGHEATVLDYGTLETVAHTYPERHRTALTDIAGRYREGSLFRNGGNPLHLWQLRVIDRTFRQALDAVCRGVAQDIARGGYACALFYLDSNDDFRAASAIARMLRREAPSVRVAGVGPFVDLFQQMLFHADDALDALFTGDTEAAVCRWVAACQNPAVWHAIPNMIFRDGARLVQTPRKAGGDPAALPTAQYGPGTYPALLAHEKLRLFQLEESRGNRPSFAGPGLRPADFRVRAFSPRSLCEEMWQLGQLFGSRVFHIAGAGSPDGLVEATAQEILARGLNVAYSRTAPILRAPASILPVVQASGCLAVSYRVDTGSQRLLEGHFGRDCCISQIERLLRTSKALSMFTVARFMYPVPNDDYHTREETLRLLFRTRPHAAPVELPQVVPQTAWFDRASEFGFGIDAMRHVMAAATQVTRFPYTASAWRALPDRIGTLSPAQAWRANEELRRFLERQGIWTACSETQALVAAIVGFAGREGEFNAAVQHQFLVGDVSGLAAHVESFNRNAARPAFTSHWSTAPGRQIVAN